MVALRLLGALLAVAAAAAVLVGTWRHLDVELVLDGLAPGYRLPDLVVAAAAAGAVVVCAAAVRAARHRLSALLLAGPLLLVVLGLERAVGETSVVLDGSYVPAEGVTMSQAYGSELLIDFYASPVRSSALLLVALVTGALLAAAALRAPRR